MQIQMDEGLNPYDRVRVTWEGAFLVDEDISREYTDFEHFGGRTTVCTSQRRRLSVDNPERVWVQSLDPDKIRDQHRAADELPPAGRIRGYYASAAARDVDTVLTREPGMIVMVGDDYWAWTGKAWAQVMPRTDQHGPHED